MGKQTNQVIYILRDVSSREAKMQNYGKKKRTNKAINLKVSQNMESFTFVPKQRCFGF